MKAIESILLTSTLTFLITGCIQTNSSFNEEVVAQEVKAVFNQYLEAVNRGEAMKIPSYFSNDESFYWVEDGFKVYSDKETMVKSLEQFTENATDVSMQTDDLTITVLSDEFASLYTSYVQTIKFSTGFELTLDGAITITLKKEEGEWKFLNGHSSTKKPRGTVNTNN